MAFETRITGLTIHELLRVIANSALSGILEIRSPEREGRIVFTWGRVTHATVEGQRRIGEMLLDRDLIDEKQLENALRKQAESRRPRPLGVIISALGYVDARTIEKVLREQMKSAFFEMMEWTTGTAKLEVDIAMALASVRLDVNLPTQTLLLEAARRRDEAAGITTPAPGALSFAPAAGAESSGAAPEAPVPSVFEELQILETPESVEGSIEGVETGDAAAEEGTPEEAGGESVPPVPA